MVPCRFCVFTGNVFCCVQQQKQQQFCCHRWWLDTDVILGESCGSWKEKPSEIMKLLRWSKTLHECPQVPSQLCRSELPLCPFLPLQNYAALYCFFFILCVFVYETEANCMCCGLTILGKLKVLCSKQRAVSTGFSGIFCITPPEETFKQAPFFFFLLQRFTVPLFVQNVDSLLHFLSPRCTLLIKW